MSKESGSGYVDCIKCDNVQIKFEGEQGKPICSKCLGPQKFKEPIIKEDATK